MEQLNLMIVGQPPLVMHNGILADPLNEIALQMKDITSKRKKTKDDYHELGWLEWVGGLYYSEELGPYLPSANLESMLNDGARRQRKGKDTLAGLIVEKDAPLDCEWPKKKKLREIFASGAYTFRCIVGVKQNRIARVRPIFRNWRASFTVLFDPEILDQSEILTFAQAAGRYVGIGDAKPRYGRFQAEAA